MREEQRTRAEAKRERAFPEEASMSGPSRELMGQIRNVIEGIPCPQHGGIVCACWRYRAQVAEEIAQAIEHGTIEVPAPRPHT